MALRFQPVLMLVSCLAFTALTAIGAGAPKPQSLDEKVKAFLDSRRGQWRDLNVPANDGRILYDLVVKGRYKRALEIGTSTGHSGIWIAWALSKTGGKLITVEIDEGRHREAVANFAAAGLSDYIDARLTLPRLAALREYWEDHPPLHLMVAAYLGIKSKRPRKTKRNESLSALTAAFAAAGGTVSGHA